MSKEDIFSKFNIKDYNNELEKILEKKSFSEGAKNILLNILYKMETSFDDYKKVKVFTKSKKELLEEIIDIINNNCKEIELVKPSLNEDTKLGHKKYTVEKDKIISYPNEKNLFYALNSLSNKKFYIMEDKYWVIKEAMENLLNKGYVLDKDEIIRDFDGWTWSIVPNEIEDYTSGLVYQNIKILLGNELLDTALENDKNYDFIANFEKAIDSIPNESETNNLAKLIYKIALLEDVKDDATKRENILNIKSSLKNELGKMENKKEYLQEIANYKKEIKKDIKEIDEKLNNNILLRKSFIKENELLDQDKRIFSLSEYTEVLQENRKNLLKQLDDYSELMKPMNFVKKKTQILNKYEILEDINEDIDYNSEIYKSLIELQKNFIELFDCRINSVQFKKEIIEYIYLFRYYKLIYVNSEKQIKDVEEISNEIKKAEKNLITKACKLKALNILCQDIEKNYEFISKILSYNIIDLEDINLQFKKNDKTVVLNIYDDNILEDSIIYDINEELNVKFNKKIKLFN